MRRLSKRSGADNLVPLVLKQQRTLTVGEAADIAGGDAQSVAVVTQCVGCGDTFKFEIAKRRNRRKTHQRPAVAGASKIPIHFLVRVRRFTAFASNKKPRRSGAGECVGR